MGWPKVLPSTQSEVQCWKCLEPLETTEPPSSSAHSLPQRAQGAFCQPLGTCHPPAWPPQHPAQTAAAPGAECPRQPPDRQELTTVLRGIRTRLRRAQRAIRLHLMLRQYEATVRTLSPHVAQATTPVTTVPPSHPPNIQELAGRLRAFLGLPRGALRAVPPRGRALRGSPQ